MTTHRLHTKKKNNRKKVPKIKISSLTPYITSEPRLSANYFFKLYKEKQYDDWSIVNSIGKP